MFYTITVEDPAHAVYDTPPVPQVLLHGRSTTVTLNKAEGVTWTAVNGQTGATLSLPMTEETAVTYTIENIAAPILFRPRVAAGMIQYEVMPEGCTAAPAPPCTAWKKMTPVIPKPSPTAP